MSEGARTPLAYTVDGPKDGTPLVLLHGFPLDHTMWDDQKDLGDLGFRLVLPDLRGHGKSPTFDEPSTMARCADDVFRLMDHLGFPRFVLAGFSLGGYVALQMTVQAPERIEGLILTDTRAEPDSAEGKAGRAKTIQALQTDGMKALVESMVPKFLTERGREKHPDVVERLTRTILRNPVKGAIHALEGMAERPDQRPNLAKIRAPTLIVVGAEDKLTPPEAAIAMKAAIPDSQIRILTGAAHLSTLEAAEAYNHVVGDWLKALKARPQPVKLKKST